MMKLSLFTPEKTILQEERVKEILVPSRRGYLGILPGHAPLVSLLEAGVLKYWLESSPQEKKFALGWGYLEVYDGGVRILAESVAVKETLDRAKVEKELKQIVEKLEAWDTIEPVERKKLEKEKLRLEGEISL